MTTLEKSKRTQDSLAQDYTKKKSKTPEKKTTTEPKTANKEVKK